MDKERIKKWLNDSVEVAHELSNRKLMCCSATVKMPYDVAEILVILDVLEKGDDGRFYYFIKKDDYTYQVQIKTTLPKRGNNKFSVIIHK